MEIEVWSDIVCPWCYLGNVRLKKAIARLDDPSSVTVRTRAFELNPFDSQVPRDNLEYLSEKYMVSAEEARGMDERIAAMAAEDGVPFTIGRPTANSFDLHRAVYLAREHCAGEQLFDKLQFALFGEGVNVFEHELLVADSVELGVPEERIRGVLNGTEFSDQVRADENEAEQIGIGGVPFAVIDRRWAIPGAAATDQYFEVLSSPPEAAAD
jgi:predicted DsbA family dithiol-disulfide isomerase